MEDGSPVAALLSNVGGHDPIRRIRCIFVGAGHHGMIAARYLTEASGSVCLLDQRPIAAKPHIAPSESFMDDPQDFKKRSRTASPYETPNPHDTYWLCGRLLRDVLGVAESTRAQGRRDG
jgi:choline dehydrogenase-like flavoprotein